MQNLTSLLIIVLAVIGSSCSPYIKGVDGPPGRMYFQMGLSNPHKNSEDSSAKSKSYDPRPQPNNQEKFIAARHFMAEKNYQGALELYKGIASEGIDKTQDLSKKDARQNLVLLKQEQNLIESMGMIGRIYERGFLGNKDYAEAAKWYMRAAEVNPTNLASMYAMKRLQLFYYYGLGVPQSKAETMAWLQRLVAPWGQRIDVEDLAITKFAIEIDAMPASLDEYDNFDIRATYQKAVESLSKGNKEEGARLMLSCVVHGKDSKDNLLHEAEAKSGYFFLHGEGLPKNHEYAINLLTRAANSGNGQATLQLAMMHRSGEHVQKDKAKSDELLRKAADSGSVDAKKVLSADAEAVKEQEIAKQKKQQYAEEAEKNAFARSGIPPIPNNSNSWVLIVSLSGHDPKTSFGGYDIEMYVAPSTIVRTQKPNGFMIWTKLRIDSFFTMGDGPTYTYFQYDCDREAARYLASKSQGDKLEIKTGLWADANKEADRKIILNFCSIN